MELPDVVKKIMDATTFGPVNRIHILEIKPFMHLTSPPSPELQRLRTDSEPQWWTWPDDAPSHLPGWWKYPLHDKVSCFRYPLFGTYSYISTIYIAKHRGDVYQVNYRDMTSVIHRLDDVERLLTRFASNRRADAADLTKILDAFKEVLVPDEASGSNAE